MRRLRALLFSVVLVASGCGGVTAHESGKCSPESLSVAVARREQPKQLVRVGGHYVREKGITRLCASAVTAQGSHGCGGSSLVVAHYEPNPRITVHHAQGVAWTTGTVNILGLVSGRALHVAACA